MYHRPDTLGTDGSRPCGEIPRRIPLFTPAVIVWTAKVTLSAQIASPAATECGSEVPRRIPDLHSVARVAARSD